MNELDILELDLTNAISVREEALVKGHVGSWEEYKFISGVVTGLRGALDAVKESKKRYEED